MKINGDVSYDIAFILEYISKYILQNEPDFDKVYSLY